MYGRELPRGSHRSDSVQVQFSTGDRRGKFFLAYRFLVELYSGLTFAAGWKPCVLTLASRQLRKKRQRDCLTGFEFGAQERVGWGFEQHGYEPTKASACSA